MEKLQECLLKCSFLASFTRLVSCLNASEHLCLRALYKVGTSHCFMLGDPSAVALDVVLARGVLSTGSGKKCHFLGLGECSGAGEGGAAEADGCSAGEAPCDKVNG